MLSKLSNNRYSAVLLKLLHLYDKTNKIRIKMYKLLIISLFTFSLLSCGEAKGEITELKEEAKEAIKKEKAKEKAHLNFEDNETCKACHPTIYKEYSGSMHAKASIFDDPVHAAVWNKHPKNKKLKQYVCAKCHTPAADNLTELMKKGAEMVPDSTNKSHLNGVSCAYCHRIEGIKKGAKSNTNLIAENGKEYFGNIIAHEASGFHTMKTDNKLFQNGNVCIGCHSHKENKSKIQVCTTEIKNTEEENCITCHMPKVDGTVAIGSKLMKHSFHNFPGTHNHPEMLAKYIDLAIEKKDGEILVTMKNNATHAMLLHPMRLGLLKVSIENNKGEIENLEPVTFERVLGKENKPAMPWVADSVIKNTVLQGNEEKIFTFDYKLNTEDKVNIVLGYYLVNPRMLKGLGLEDNEEITKFYILKTLSE